MFKKRIDDNYKANPIKINTKEENEKMNLDLAAKVSKRTKAYKGFLGSDNCKRILGGIVNPKFENMIKGENAQNNDKITKNNFDINQKAVMINKNNDNFVPYYGKRHFRCVSFGKKSFTFA